MTATSSAFQRFSSTLVMLESIPACSGVEYGRLSVRWSTFFRSMKRNEFDWLYETILIFCLYLMAVDQWIHLLSCTTRLLNDCRFETSRAGHSRVVCDCSLSHCPIMLHDLSTAAHVITQTLAPEWRRGRPYFPILHLLRDLPVPWL